MKHLENNRYFTLTMVLVLVAAALGTLPTPASASISIRVKVSGSNAWPCGGGWVVACSLQTALENAATGDELWVAEGVYIPTDVANNRTASFNLPDGVAIYGGFDGETDAGFSDSNPIMHPSILSGDIDHNDTNMDGNHIDETAADVQGGNSFHVVTCVNDAILEGFTITGGKADEGEDPISSGGGMWVYYGSPVLRNITFSGNWAVHGGGMYIDRGAGTLTNVTFSGNAASYGGGMMSYLSNPSLTNVTFSDNTASYGGGLISEYRGPTLTNVTFSGNTATILGGGIYNIDSSSLIRNSLLWGNTAPLGAQIYTGGTIVGVINDSVVQGGYADGTNIITTDPRLGALGNYGGYTSTIPLLLGSSAINATSSNCPITDQRGVTRPFGASCDIGAYEFNYAGPYYVKPNASGVGNCESWANACILQTALSMAGSGSELWVAGGVYKPTSVTTDRTATFHLPAGAVVYGGFDGELDATISDRNPAEHPTILSGDIDANDTNVDGNYIDETWEDIQGYNSYHVVTGAEGSMLDSFTITGGKADDVECPVGCGGGMINANSSPTLYNVNFSGNYAGRYGGGMYIDHGSGILTNITFSGNSAYTWGGGLYNETSSPDLTNVTFNGNSAYSGGGMFNNFSSNPSLTNVTFSGNSAESFGGGMLNVWSSSPGLTNVTISGNSAYFGGGMYNVDSTPLVRNSLLWANKALADAQIYNDGSDPVVINSIVEDGYPDGTNIITTDPLLGPLGSYGGFTQTIPLLHGSSAYNATSSNCPETDQRGVPRGSTCNIGAFEGEFYPISLPLVIR